jgi:hypothetical protein
VDVDRHLETVVVMANRLDHRDAAFAPPAFCHQEREVLDHWKEVGPAAAHHGSQKEEVDQTDPKKDCDDHCRPAEEEEADYSRPVVEQEQEADHSHPVEEEEQQQADHSHPVEEEEADHCRPVEEEEADHSRPVVEEEDLGHQDPVTSIDDSAF